MDSAELEMASNAEKESPLPEITGHADFKRTLLSSIGAHELFTPEMWRAALTELVATASLMFILTSGIISCLDSHVPDPKLLIPFIVFVVFFLFIMAVAPLSGGHMNPIFTFAATLKGIISLTRAASYVVAQCIGSIMGFMLVKCIMGHEEAVKYSLGGCTVVTNGAAHGLGLSTALMLEFVCTFVVLFVGMTVAFDHRRCADLGPTMVCVILAGIIGLVVFVSVTITGRPAYAGVGLNPARCLGPAILQDGRLWEGHWVFWVGPFLGCIVYYCYSRNMPDGLVMGDGELDFVNLVFRLVGK